VRAVVLRAEGRAREALVAAEEVLSRHAVLGGRYFYVKLGFVDRAAPGRAVARARVAGSCPGRLSQKEL
jgi:hypothetical protein